MLGYASLTTTYLVPERKAKPKLHTAPALDIRLIDQYEDIIELPVLSHLSGIQSEKPQNTANLHCQFLASRSLILSLQYQNKTP
jgi:hypothetical protein